MEQELERLEGTVEDIIYLNEDNGYTVFEVVGRRCRHRCVRRGGRAPRR